MSSNATLCAQGSGIEIVQNKTQSSPICGVRSLNSSVIAPCCGDSSVSTYNCQQFCSTATGIQDWTSCVQKHSGSDSIPLTDVFCQSGISGNTTETLAKTSFAVSRPSPPTFKHALVFLTLFALFFGTVSAKTIPSLKHLATRDTAMQAACRIDIEKDYTTARSVSAVVSPQYQCGGRMCTTEVLVDTGILNNNRTINGSSAADPMFDSFFELLQNQTGHWFPAMSSSQLAYSFAYGPGLTHLTFTPFARCLNGTVTDCSGVGGNTNQTTYVHACGPVFVTEPNAGNIQNASIQGVLSPVVSG